MLTLLAARAAAAQYIKEELYGMHFIGLLAIGTC